MADSMFSKVAKVPKRVPKWAWYVSGGVLVAGGLVYFRNRQTVDQPAGDMTADEGAVGYTDPQTAPGIIVPPVIGGDAVPAEINTDIPTSTLDLLGGLFGDVVGALPTFDPSDYLQLIAGAGSPQAGSTAGGVVTASPPPAKPAAPKPNPCSKLGGGYNCGSTVTMGNVRKAFRGAVGWTRIGSGGSGANHYIDVHVRYCSKLERWRVYPNRKGAPWSKTWSGARPGIC